MFQVRWSLCYIVVPLYVAHLGGVCEHVGVVRVASDVPNHQDLRMAIRFTSSVTLSDQQAVSRSDHGHT